MKKKIFGIILCVAIAASIGVTASVSTAFAYDTTMSEWGLEHFSELDVGIYWYTEINGTIPTKDYKVDKEKPTIVFAHGWKPTDSNVREGLSLKSNTESAVADKGYSSYTEDGYDPEFYNYYLKNGYNVGVFYWNQIAGTGGPLNFGLDTKIWASYGGKNMTYKKYSDVNESGMAGEETSPNDPTNPKKSVAMLYADAIIDALGDSYDKPLHLAGHSMGGQLTLAVGEALCIMSDKGKIDESLLPERMTLLDPYLSSMGRVTGVVDHKYKSVNGVITAYLAAEAAETCATHGIPIEAYGVNETMVFRNYNFDLMGADENSQEVKDFYHINKLLGDNCVWVYMKSMANVYGGFDPTHVMSVDYYFTTNDMEPVKSREGLTVPCATMPTEDLYAVIGRCFKQEAPRSENPLYYTSGDFHLVNFYTETISEYTEDDGKSYIAGNIEVSHRNGKSVVVKLLDSNGKVVDEANVDYKGNYHFSNVKEGEYSIKIYADTMPIKEIEGVEVKGNSVDTVKVDSVEIVMGGDKLLFWSILVIAGIIVLVCIGGLIGVIVKSVKKNKAKNA